MESIKFGVAGLPDNFNETSALKMPQWLHEIGLDAFEYQCGRGVKVSADSAAQLKEEADKHNITMSLHSPYFVNIASSDPTIVENSMKYIMQSVEAANAMGARRVVVHMGAGGNVERAVGIANSKRFISAMYAKLDEMGFSHIHLCPETMGKVNQLGTVAETIDVCKIDERLIPTLDFGHINSRNAAASLIKGEPVRKLEKADYVEIIDSIRKHLGEYRAKSFHCHFSKIEYTKGGEKRHTTFADTEYGPEFEPFAEAIRELSLTPIIICESSGTQDVDALFMKKMTS